MKPLWLTGRLFAILGAPLVLAGALTAIPAGASAATCVSGTQPPNPGTTSNGLSGVTVLSPCNAWAVGTYLNDTAGVNQTLIEHWNGSSWKQVTSPNPGAADDSLTAVDAVSARDIWAAGFYLNPAAHQDQTLFLHWNGSSWKHVASPNRGITGGLADFLTGVHAVSSRNVWAVGYYDNEAGPRQTLIEHWNGHTWKLVKSPDPGGSGNGDDNDLAAVAGSATSAWAVGSYRKNRADQTLVLHWNGHAWKHVASPNRAGNAFLTGVRVISRRNAWAVGSFYNGTAFQTFIVHWNGHAWRRVASPNPGGSARDNRLMGLTAVSATSAWAVGSAAGRTLVLHWNGRVWRHEPTPNPTLEPDILLGVDASSGTNVWAVGQILSARRMTLALHLS
jgi:hypothetical protein